MPPPPKRPSSGHPPPPHFRVVGVCASAGGIASISRLVEKIDPKTKSCFIIAQHLAADQESSLPEILSIKTSLPISTMHEPLFLGPGKIFILPSNQNLSYKNGKLTLKPESLRPAEPDRFDLMLDCIAQYAKKASIGVILSGLGNDGTAGTLKVHQHGGLNFAEDPDSALYPSMPESAIQAGGVDFVLTPEAIAGRLNELDLFSDSSDALSLLQPNQQEQHLDRVADLLYAKFSFDLKKYKSSTVLRRIERRTLLTKRRNLEDYVEFLEGHPGELPALHSELLIHVTSFFRNPEVFETLKKEIIPELVENKPNKVLRVWCIGCSTGEEAYSTAITFLEYMREARTHFQIQVFGTDLSPEVIDRARRAEYTAEDLEKISPRIVEDYFDFSNDVYRVKKNPRNLCVFSPHDVLVDPPFSKIDLVLCRNLIIYLRPESQNHVFSQIHYALADKGVFVSGRSESVGRNSKLFTASSIESKFFRKIPGNNLEFFLNTTAVGPLPEKPGGISPTALLPSSSNDQEYDLSSEVDRVISVKLSPAAFVVDQAMVVVQIRGDTAPYTHLAPGPPTFSLFKILKTELHDPVSDLIRRANDKPGSSPFRLLKDPDSSQKTDIRIQTMRMTGASEGEHYFIVVLSSQEGGEHTANQAPEESSEGKRQFHNLIDGYEVALHRLRKSNEETTSNNEELQSLNEELQTAKEELQSSNEELRTVNDEIHSKNHQLTVTSDDLNNFMTSSGLAIVMIGKDFGIRQYTPEATNFLKLIPSDIGRPISDIKSTFQFPDLTKLAESVLANLQIQDIEIQSDSNQYLLFARPYKTSDGRVDGVTFSFVDISEVRRAEAELNISRLMFSRVFNESPIGIVILKTDGSIELTNASLRQMLGYDEAEIKLRSINALTFPDDRKGSAALIKSMASEKNGGYQIETRYLRKDGTVLWASFQTAVIRGADGKIQYLLGMIEDIGDRRREHEKLRAFLDSAPTATVIIDNGSKIVMVNTETEQLFGYQRNELLGKSARILVPERYRRRHQELMSRYLRDPTPHPMRKFPWTARHKNGKEFPVYISLSPVLTNNKLYLFSAISDATDSVKREKRLSRSKEMAEIENRQKSELLAYVSHEIRTPLSAIVSFSDLLSFGNTESEAKTDYARQIRSSGRHLMRVLDNLLDLSKIEAHRMEVENKKIHLGAFLHEIMASFANQAKKNQITFRLLTPESLPEFAETDPTLLRQILLNLISNAIKFTEKGEVTLSGEVDGDQLIIWIEDSGCGIAKSSLANLFEPFFKGERTNHPKTGTGLGLALSRKIAQTLGGNVTVDRTAPNKGTLFKIVIRPNSMGGQLDLQSVDFGSLETGLITREHKFQGKDKTVLLIEDNEDVGRATQLILGTFGLNTIWARTIAEGLEAALGKRTDLVLMDVQMPDGTGYEATRSLRESGYKRPIIAFTARSGPTEKRQMANAGCTDYLAKPFSYEEIANKLKLYLQ